MRLVVDANVLIAAFLKDSITRKLLLDDRLNLITPEHGFMEARRVLLRKHMLKRIGLDPVIFEKLWEVVTSRIHTVPEYSYNQTIMEALHLAVHPEDSPYIALAMQFRCPIWTNDPDFQIHPIKKTLVIYTTRDLLKKLGHS